MTPPWTAWPLLIRQRPRNAGISGYDHLWPDLSPSGADELRALHLELREQAASCPIPDARHELAQRVLLDYCDEAIRYHDSGGHLTDLNTIASPHQGLRFIYGSMADDTPEAWHAIIARLVGTTEALDGFRDSLEAGRTRGLVVSRRQVLEVIDQGTSAIGEGSSYDSLRARLAASPVDAEQFSSDLDAGIASAKAAFAAFNEYLAEVYLPDATDADGVGEERYVRAA